MNPFPRILLGMDLSDMDYHLIHYLHSFSVWYPPEKVYAVHVSPSLEVPIFVRDMYKQEAARIPMDEAIEEELKQELTHRLPQPNFPVEIDVLEGEVTAQLLHWVDVKGIDLAILGKKESSMGSGLAAKRFVRQAPCSVLFLSPNAHLHIKRILVPTDYSSDAKSALTEAIRLAKMLPHPPEIIHQFVYTIPNEIHLELLKSQESVEERMRKGAIEYHRRYIRDIDTQGITIIPEIQQKKRGNVAWHIHQYAKKADIDLIIMGAKGHNSLSSFLLGSVTEKLLDYQDTIPILIKRTI